MFCIGVDLIKYYAQQTIKQLKTAGSISLGKLGFGPVGVELCQQLMGVIRMVTVIRIPLSPSVALIIMSYTQ
jgi:hypothetical protein